METRHLIVQGDSRQLARVPTASVQLVVTSPPYWQLKDYGSSDQIGFHHSYEDYVNALNQVWQECVRVLRPSGRLCINVGDQFARAAYYGRYKVIPIRTEIIRFLETVGLDHMGAIIWQKITTCNTSGGATVMGSFPYPTNGVIKLDYEFILLFKKPGRRQPPPEPEHKLASKLTTDQWNQYFSGHWRFPGVRQQRHLAAFPAELPRRLLRMFSFVGDTVLDPFLGSGTTSLVALEEGRHSIGYELNQEFLEICRQRLLQSPALLDAAALRFEQDPRPAEGAIRPLPYLFQDPVGIQRPRRLQRFGSRIDGKEKPAPRTFKVLGVPAHATLEIEGGRRIRLLGVGELCVPLDEALAGLAALCANKRVTLAADSRVADEDLLYVHLPNRKFINAHVLKRGLALPDRVRLYRHRTRFERYAAEARGE